MINATLKRNIYINEKYNCIFALISEYESVNGVYVFTRPGLNCVREERYFAGIGKLSARKARGNISPDAGTD